MKTTPTNEPDLDALDKQILEQLTDASKSSLAAISKQIGISTTAVHQRVKKLEQAGVIQPCVTLLNPKTLGYKVVCYIGVYLDKPSDYSDCVEALKEIDEVVEAHYTTGNYTLFLKVYCKDNDHLMALLNQLQKFKGVTRTETFLSLEQRINRQIKP